VGKINIAISDELEREFRIAVFERKGMKKGNKGVQNSRF